MAKPWKQWLTLFSWAQKSLQMVIAGMKLRHLLLGRKAMPNLDSIPDGNFCPVGLQPDGCPVHAAHTGAIYTSLDVNFAPQIYLTTGAW